MRPHRCVRRLACGVPEDWRLFFEFLAVTGLRISEAVGLRWEHIDLGEASRVKVREQLYRGKRKRLNIYWKLLHSREKREAL